MSQRPTVRSQVMLRINYELDLTNAVKMNFNDGGTSFSHNIGTKYTRPLVRNKHFGRGFSARLPIPLLRFQVEPWLLRWLAPRGVWPFEPLLACGQ